MAEDKGVVEKAADVANKATDKAAAVAKTAANKTASGVSAVWDAVKDNPGHAVAGAIIGQILIPIPGVGLAIGGGIGGWIGKKRR